MKSNLANNVKHIILCVNLYTLLVLEISLPTIHLFDKELAKCNTDHEDWQKTGKKTHTLCI